MKKYIIILFILIIGYLPCISQRNYKYNKKEYQQALKLFSKEDYQGALKLFLGLDSVPTEYLITDPHENKYVVDQEAIPEMKILIKYHIGMCYYNLNNDKKKAIPYFEYILRSNYTREPESIYIDLGTIYHDNYQFDRAILCFDKFIKLYGEKGSQNQGTSNSNYDYAQKMIEACRVAGNLYNDSMKTTVQNIGPPINNKNSQFNPLITADDSHLFFNQVVYSENGNAKDSVIQIMVAEKLHGNWQMPKQIAFNPPVNNKTTLLGGITPDGQQLFLQVKEGDNTHIYNCILSDNRCEDLHKLSPPINSNYSEGRISMTADGTELYFTSNRPGGFGGKDIYKSTKNEKGEWSTPKNLGPVINSKFDEDAPFIHADKRTLYFCSNGTNTMGGSDIFKSTLKDSLQWSTPLNIGYPVNTIYNENDISVPASGQTGYFSKADMTVTSHNIRHIYTYKNNQNIPLTLVKGTIMAGDPLKPVAAKIKVIDKQTNTRVKYIYDPNPKTGQYLMIFPPGKDYDIIVEAKDYLPQLINVHIPNQTYFYELFQEIHLKPVNLLDKRLGEEVSVSNTFIDIYQTPAGKPIILKSGQKDYGKLLNLVDKLINTTDSIGLDKVDKAFDKIFKEQEIKKDSSNKKDIDNLLSLVESAIQTTDTTTLNLLNKNTVYSKDYTKKYFYSEGKPIDLHKSVIGKDTIYSAPPLNTKGNTGNQNDSSLANLFHNEKKMDVRNIKPNEKKFILTYKVYFASGKADIENKYYQEMRQIVALMKNNPNLYLEIYGYCDSRGGIEENIKLSEERADNVLKYFNEIGINTESATVIGFGKTYAKDEKSDEDRQMNRRVDVKIFEYVKKKM